jgi:hypothetical protein
LIRFKSHKQPTIQSTTNNNKSPHTNHMESAPTFYPFEINGEKYLICKLPDQPFSTLHDPNTKQMVGQWNNDTAQYVLYPLGNLQVLTPEQLSHSCGKEDTSRSQ